jgi:uncharacterized membrane protein
MSPTLEVLLWWVAFAGAHLVLSSLPVRRRVVAALGERVFQGLYSLVVLVLFVPLVLAYFANKHTGPVLWALPPGPVLRWVTYVGVAVALVLVVGSQITPSPANLVPGAARARGVLRITRHPFIMGTALWALAHLPSNGHATDVVFFGGFVVFAVVGAWHQDARKLAANLPGYREFCAAAPFFPFTGQETLRGLREAVPAAAVGIAATVVVRWYHAAWFGG